MIYYLRQPKPYAETHYTFRAVPISRYHRRRPEIIADAPRRVEPGHDLPILIIVKDAHRYPITLHAAQIQWVDSNLPPQEFPIEEHIDIPYWSKLLNIPTATLPKKPLKLDVQIKIKHKHEEHIVCNHDYVGIPPSPLEVNISDHPLPKLPGWLIGDLHVHTRYTDDQVEFGAPITATTHIAKAQGYDFFAATDHSYNLDDSWDSYLKNDPSLPKYQACLNEINQWNQKHGSSFTIIPGEEVSVGNHRNRNIHLLALGAGDFIPGKGDSAETWFHNHPDLTIKQVIDRLNGHRIAVAAHPDYLFPRLERFFLRRGSWEPPDFLNDGIIGIQIIRGNHQIPFQQGTTLWVKMLLQGLRLSITSGSDAHGDFNRSIIVKTPMVKLRQSPHPVFGEALTLIPSSNTMNTLNILSQIRKGRTGITTGPAVSLLFRDHNGTGHLPGDHCPESTGNAIIQAASSPEFGTISNVAIWAGNPKLQAEELVWIHKPTPSTFQMEHEIPVENIANWSYLRAEIQTSKNSKIGRALTGAIYLQ
ncbi:hypothetical protein AMJ86_10215 [bacterium SM23_57]|nr:MAG: hypothetical protein AMJ86_10215 [bacterium SM23_57]